MFVECPESNQDRQIYTSTPRHPLYDTEIGMPILTNRHAKAQNLILWNKIG